MSPKTGNKDKTQPRKPSKRSSQKQSEQASTSKKKEKKRKKLFQPPAALMASFWWIVAIVTLVVGGIGLVQLILSLAIMSGPDWSYALVLTQFPRDAQVILYHLEGSKSDLNIRAEKTTTFDYHLEWKGIDEYYERRIKQLEKDVPFLSRSSSPIIFAGSGDMRILRKDNKTLFEKTEKKLKKLFKTSRLKYLTKSFYVLEDWEEALHGWVALNHLTNTMTKGRQPIKRKRDTFTTRISLGGLDIGTTSTHISYEVPAITPDTKLETEEKKRIRMITLFGRVYYIYTQSLLCYGENRIMDMYMGYRIYEWTSWYDKEEDHACFNEPYKMGTKFSSDTAISYLGELHGACSRSDWSRLWMTNKSLTGHMRYQGGADPETCLKEVKEMIAECKKYFTDNSCPELKFPKRRYNVTFVGFNEFARYALMAGLKNGDTKEVWNQKRNEICRTRYLRDLRKKYSYKTAEKRHYQNLCLMITYMYYFLTEKLNLTKDEWKKLKILHNVDDTGIVWQIGYLGNITKSFPTIKPNFQVVSLQEIYIYGLAWTALLTLSSLAAAIALRNSNTLAMRPLQLP